MNKSEVSQRAQMVIAHYFQATGQECPQLTGSTRLVRDTGLSSDDGVNLVLDLCVEFGVSIPDNFNATVHDDGRRDRTFGELVTCIQSIINTQE